MSDAQFSRRRGIFQDLTGERFSRLIVVGFAGKSKHGQSQWLCRCDCGNEKEIIAGSLKSGKTKSCGCLKSEVIHERMFIDLTGRRVGTLTVLSISHQKDDWQHMWNVRCDCGKEFTVIGQTLRDNKIKSCGCLYYHGGSKGPEYKCWAGMKGRCLNPDHNDYARYGGIGVTICDSWANSFSVFLKEIGPRPSRWHSLDRFPDPNGNYEPGNVRWATPKQQARNRRNTKTIEFRGENLTLSEWSERSGIQASTIKRRLDCGWDVERALTTLVP